MLDDGSEELRPLGGASKWWLDKSLRALSTQIEARGGRLVLRRGGAREVIANLVNETGASGVFWNRRYAEPEREMDTQIKEALKRDNVVAESFNGSLLTEPWATKTNSGGYYRVFTPYWRALRAKYTPPEPNDPEINFAGDKLTSDHIDDWALHPSTPDWSAGLNEAWTPGEAGAAARLERFLDGPVSDYDEHRNRPDMVTSTSGLSPHLRWGEISPVQIWRATLDRLQTGDIAADGAWTFLSEIAWREFSYALMYYNPNLASENYNSDFNHMPWRDDAEALQRWRRGLTGFPIVDAGMRQLWTTGWMHNRVRMIVASFLTKHLLIDWRRGEDWFWDTLVDADPASNSASWQWTAGSGADAAPYFRVFNPITQGQKFDPEGAYTLRWLPELKDVPTKHLFSPWECPASQLEAAGVVLGADYPEPMIEHKAGRERALAAYETLKERRDAA